MIEELKIEKTINKTFANLPVPQDKIKNLKKNLETYKNGSQQEQNGNEEFYKNLISDFLKNTWYKDTNLINTYHQSNKLSVDLAIYSGKGNDSKIAVLIEVKSPKNKDEMFSIENPNCKALQECVYYFLKESVINENKEIKNIIITNYDDFYIFSAKDLSRFFVKELGEDIKKHSMGLLTDNTTDYFYQNCAKPAIDEWLKKETIKVTHFSPKEFYDKEDTEIIRLYKIFSPEHLLDKPFANDSNSLDKNFYSELLHIIGLEEVKDGSKKLIKRKSEGKRDDSSLLECVISKLKDRNVNENEQFEIALRLCITWINRLLFLKLVESQLLSYQKGNKNYDDYKFLTIEKIPNFGELYNLFFKVLAFRVEMRPKELKEKFRFVPYLNSSLFELNEEEIHNFSIDCLQNNQLNIFKQTVLKDKNGKRQNGTKELLRYIFEFLDAYNFSSNAVGGLVETDKTLINASVLGLIFEKINGYKDGSFFTPGFITEYMAKESIERTVIQKFNTTKDWNCKSLADVREKIDDKAIDSKEAVEIFNTIRVLDPAVGSGHFLVSALNRLLYIKSYLNILFDNNGEKLSNGRFELSLENDEIRVKDTDEDKFFEYNVNSKISQRVQEALFNEKRTIIENSLFGVDINPASVYICRLRLWIELLKNSYYTKESNYFQLETLPNIDINIKCGNSLVSKYPVKIGASVAEYVESDATKTKEFKKNIINYKAAVSAYKNESNKKNKGEVDDEIKKIKDQICGAVQYDLFDEDLNKRMRANDIYKNSMEWMIEFPEVLDDNGNFLGFDAVIGNPPYGVSIKDNYRYQVEKALGKVPDYEIYYYFIQSAKSLLSDSGHVSLIIPNTWLFNTNAKKYRLNILKEWQIDEILDCSKFKIFESADVYNSIISFKKVNKTDNTIGYRPTATSTSFSDLITKKRINISKDSLIEMNQNWGLAFRLPREIIELVNKITNVGSKLEELFPEYTQGLIAYDKYQGQDEETIKNRVFHSYKYRKGLKKWLWGEDVRRYKTVWNGKEYIDYRFDEIANPRQPKFFKGKRLLVREITNPSIFADIVDDELYNDPAILIILDSKQFSLEVLLAIMNSKLATFYHFNHSPKATKGAFPKILVDDLKNFPLPVVTEKQEKKIIELVEKIQASKKENINSDTTALEQKIDSLVYQLYGLTEKEIAIIENS